MEKSKRIPIIDEVRGLSIILMVVYHFFFDLVIIFGVNIPLFFTPFINGLVMLFAGTFIFISGCSCQFSHNNLKRGVICFCFGLALTAVTGLIMPSELVLFGILHMLGVCMALFPLINRLIKGVPPVVGMIGSAILFLLTFNIANGYIGSFGIRLFEIPQGAYSLSFLFPFGFPQNGFFSSDYFPLLPWIFCFYCGAFFGRLVKNGVFPKWFYASHIPPLAFVGRHTLIIYLLHQPIVYGALWLIFNYL